MAAPIATVIMAPMNGFQESGKRKVSQNFNTKLDTEDFEKIRKFQT